MTPTLIRASVITERVAWVRQKEIGNKLIDHGVLDSEHGLLLRQIAGYRNRMVHFYYEISSQELYLLTTQHVGDIERICGAMVEWIRKNPDMIDNKF